MTASVTRPPDTSSIAHPAPFRSRWRRVMAGLAWLFIPAVSVCSVAAYAGGWHWYADLFSHFRPQYLVSLILAAPVAIRFRRWGLAVLAMAGIAVNVFEMLPHAKRTVGPPTPAEAGQSVRCVSLNVLQGNKEPEAVERFIRESGADLLVFQEVTPACATMLEQLKPLYPGQFLRGRKDSKGAALLTRLPLENVRFEPLPGQTQIGAVIAEVRAPGGTFTIFGIHSHKPTSGEGARSQVEYFRWLAERARELHLADRPVVIMGDFNSTRWARALRQFIGDSQLLDTSGGALFEASWSSRFPQRMLIDHAFVSPEWKLAAREVGPRVGSDHRPVVVDLVLSK